MQKLLEEHQELADHTWLSELADYPNSAERLINAHLAGLERDGLFPEERGLPSSSTSPR